MFVYIDGGFIGGKQTHTIYDFIDEQNLETLNVHVNKMGKPIYIYIYIYIYVHNIVNN